ncbi:MAG: 5'-3' exonuclease [Patescibacteria group bacterium]
MPTSFNKKILIMDGSHYLYRAYYGVPESAKLPSGLKVNAVYGFMAYLRKVVKVVEPTGIVVIFDSETGITDKVAQEKSYKANRDYTDVGMYEQLPLIKEILEYVLIKYVEPQNHEADDYIGSLARKFSNDDTLSLIFSNDADFLQLISANINVVKMGQKVPEIIDIPAFREKYGFNNNLYLDYLSLKGDDSDNIKGVPGIGHKTAQNLVSGYGSLDDIYSNLDFLQKRIKILLMENRQIVEYNKNFLKINTNISCHDLDLKDVGNNIISELNQSTNYLLYKVGINIK